MIKCKIVESYAVWSTYRSQRKEKSGQLRTEEGFCSVWFCFMLLVKRFTWRRWALMSPKGFEWCLMAVVITLFPAWDAVPNTAAAGFSAESSTTPTPSPLPVGSFRLVPQAVPSAEGMNGTGFSSHPFSAPVQQKCP